MLIFVDDSGDPGFKFDKGSTSYFVIALVIFDDDLEAEKTSVRLKELRRELGFPDDVEFKFNKSNPRVKESFMTCLADAQCRVRALVVPKENIYSDELKNNKNSFYSYIIKLVLKHNGGSVFDAKIRIDGSGDRVFRKNFLGYLRKELNSGDVKIVKNCKLVDSKRDVLIQAADMAAGAIRRSYDKSKKDHSLYKNIIKDKIEDEWVFG